MDDLLFQFTEWLRSTQLTELALWIDETAAREWIVTHFWAIPIIQCFHILAIAASFASILLINPFFWIKMGLVVFGILVAIWFHKGVLKHVAAGRDIVASDKATAVFLVILWMMIMYCGRFIAYAPV